MPEHVRGVIARSPGAPVEIAQIVIPDPGSGEAAVDIAASGVCHTDLTHRQGAISDAFPFLLGHEAARHRPTFGRNDVSAHCATITRPPPSREDTTACRAMTIVRNPPHRNRSPAAATTATFEARQQPQ